LITEPKCFRKQKQKEKKEKKYWFFDYETIYNIDRDLNSRMMVETIVDLAKKLKVETIAEFVSSQEILDVITELKVDYAQGYHLGKPERIEKHLNM